MTSTFYLQWSPSWIKLWYGTFKAVWRNLGHSAYAEFIIEEDKALCVCSGKKQQAKQLKLSAKLSLAIYSTFLKMLHTCSLLKKLLKLLRVMGKVFDNLPMMSAVWLHFDSYLARPWQKTLSEWTSYTSLTVKSVQANCIFCYHWLKLKKAFA